MSIIRPCYLSTTIMRNGKGDGYHSTEDDARRYLQGVIAIATNATTPAPYVAVAIYDPHGNLIDMWVNAVDFNNRLGADCLTLKV